MKTNRWLNKTIIGIGIASLLSDWSHEMATTVLPTFLATIGGSAFALGLIEGIADGVSSFAKLFSGWYTDRLSKRKWIAIVGYFVTPVATFLFAFCTQFWHVLFVRTIAWLGRGVRTPVRKTLLAASTTPQNYGKAFGLERAMDTMGAIVGPATALFIISMSNVKSVFYWSLIPGLAAMAAITFLVQEKPRENIVRIPFWQSLNQLPPNFRKFLFAVLIFGLGDFSHTLLILLAVQQLSHAHTLAEATRLAALLYIVHNVVYASSSYISGALGDRFSKRTLLAMGYFLAAVMSGVILTSPATIISVAIVFLIAGIYVGMEEALEDSFAAELLPNELHGTGFGSLAFINAVGDLVSSIVIGLLWQKVGLGAFYFPVILAIIGAIFVLRLPRRDS
ncbi:MAG TPA: MFS transporter [Acidobacteriota bacterium]